MNETVRKKTAERARRTESKEVRRQQLIDATIRSIAKYGIRGTTMSTVTEFAGLSVGIVNFHFESKQNLFEETLVYLAREHHDHWQSARADAGLSPADKMLAIVDAHFHPRICTAKKLAVWYAFYGEASRRKIYRHLIEDIDDERFNLLITLAEEIGKDGRAASIPPRQVAYILESLFDGVWLELLTYPENLSRDEGRDQIKAFLATVFPDHFDMPDFDDAPNRPARTALSEVATP